MTVIRSPVTKMVLMVLLSFVLILVYAEDVTTPEYQDSLPVTEINARQNVDTGVLSGDNRQSRISTHAELPSSKAKREQALRNLLAARRRRILNQRPGESPHLLNRAFRTGNPSKDSGDILETQETRNGMYVTASADTSTVDSADDETSESLSMKQNGIEKAKIESKSFEIKQAIEVPIETSTNQNTTMQLNDLSKSIVSSLRLNNSSVEQDSNTVSPIYNVSSSPVPTIPGQKTFEADNRKKSTFVMPESIYNHFRPVESNIPIEDMSQFLYFGQKLHPEVQNTTSNNSVDVTPTVPTAASSRRRYSMKRYSTTTAMPVPKLEDIMNEEMNIAVERQTVEKNIVSKIKNTFRSPGSGIYYRKPRPVDSTIVSNVIPANDSGRNSTANGASRETHLPNDKSLPNSSAHARDQLQRAQERGSATHVHDETWNATDSTQILAERRRLSTNANDKDENEESSTAKSEITTLGHTLSVSSVNKSIEVTNGRMIGRSSNETNRDSKESKVKSVSTVLDIFTLERNNEMDMDARKNVAKNENANSPQVNKVNANQSNRKDRRAGIYQPNVDSTRFPELSTVPGDTDHHPDTSVSRESNNIETSTSGEKMYSKATWTTTSMPTETSTLRIVVTEVNLDRDFATAGLKTGEQDTVKPVDSAEEGVRSTASVDLPPLESAKTTIAGSVQSVGNGATTDAPVAPAIGVTEQQQQQQVQHVYAYTITNVTRLLRNYTGPGLSKEEQGGLYRRTGTGAGVEITTGAGQYTESAHRQHLQQKQEQQEPSAQSSPLPRAGSIDSARSSAELSTGTTVVQARTTATAAAPLPSSIAAGTPLVGERPRKVAPATQYSQRAQSRPPIHLHPPAVNKTVASARTRLAEGTSRGSVRWNHTKPRNSDIDGANDRRFLRKSASAVLNQRIGSNAEDESSISNTKRRRVLGNSSFFQGNQRRAKGSTTLKSIEVVTNLRTESINFNDSVSNKRKNSVNDKEDEVVRKTLRIMHLDRVNKSEDFANESPSMWAIESLTDQPPADLKDDKSASDNTVKNDTMTMDSENVTKYANEPDTKDESGASKNEIRSSNPEGKSESMSEVNGGSENVDQRNRSSAGSVTDKPKESDALKESTQTTTVSGPIFPVTPRMLTELSSASPQDTFTLNPTASVNQLTEVKSPNGSDGKTIELDPSEIQKMYRSTTAAPTEVPTTTISQSIQNKTRQLENPQTTLPATYKPILSSPSLPNEMQKHGSAERSPEVRGRNLSDKTKDKDDVLPIMHLYNTSSIFNGSASIGDVPLDDDSPRLVLPANDGTTENSQIIIPTTTPISNINDVKASTGNAPRNNNRSNPSRVPPRDSKDTVNTRVSAKKDRQDELRDTHISQESTTTATTTTTAAGTTTTTTSATTTTNGSGRLGTHGHSSGTGGNRTRHRPPPPPAYHHTILPDYNDSVYSSEINRTFFEAGLISAGPRDTVNISEVISKRHDGDAIASQETVAVVSYILATLVVFPIAVGVGLILRRLIIRNRKVLEESDTSSEISCRKDALNLENGDFKTSIEKAITKLPRIQHLCHEAEKPPPPPSQESRWEFPRDKLRLQTVLGQGNFGQVWKAEADDLTGHQGTTRLVAVKTVKEGASEREKEDLVRELEIMQQLGSHPNVVTLLGCCTEEEPHYLILEYVMYGKLLAYLRDHRTRQDFYNFSEDSAALTSRDLTVFGYCVARGMEYLASKKIIHRDLAARNVLVDHNKLCKIADFGMSRFANEDGEVIETRHGRNALPIRWMAPESLIYSLFTTKTDVWSFGILMWEIVTLGSTPYPDMTAREVMRNVQSGYRLERPSHCRSELFRVISRCWHADPDRRPEFQTLRRDLAQLLEDNMNGHYVDLESFASECTD